MKYFHFHDWPDDDMKSATADATSISSTRARARAIDADPWFRLRRGRKRKTNRGKKKEERWRTKEKKKLNGEAERRRGHRMGGRNVLGTRRVSIKWLWPVRYGGSLPWRDICIRSGSRHTAFTTCMHAACSTLSRTCRARHGARVHKGAYT